MKLKTPIYLFILFFTAFVAFMLGGVGLGPGAHRYFCHRSYKTNRAIKIFMIFCQQLSGIVRYWETRVLDGFMTFQD